MKMRITDEEKEIIKEQLYKFVEKDLRKFAVKGLPEWYKNKLMQGVIVDA
jgi:hypothetical protein